MKKSVGWRHGFADVLRDARQQKGLSQEALAEAARCHRTYISLVERGERNPSLDVIVRFADALGLPPSNLLRRVEDLLQKPGGEVPK
jgi:transcriptional regulator with XRE-family HTH domain